jgi:hypothetical protein
MMRKDTFSFDIPSMADISGVTRMTTCIIILLHPDLVNSTQQVNFDPPTMTPNSVYTFGQPAIDNNSTIIFTATGAFGASASLTCPFGTTVQYGMTSSGIVTTLNGDNVIHLGSRYKGRLEVIAVDASDEKILGYSSM